MAFMVLPSAFAGRSLPKNLLQLIVLKFRVCFFYIFLFFSLLKTFYSSFVFFLVSIFFFVVVHEFFCFILLVFPAIRKSSDLRYL